MKNENNEIKPLPADVNVLQKAPTQSASLSKQPVRKSMSNGSIGLILALAGLSMPYGAPEYAFFTAFVVALIVWELLSNGLLRVNQTFTAHKPIIPVLALVAGVLPLAVGDGSGTVGAVVTLLGSLIALSAPIMGKKADAKLPAAPAEPEIDKQFSTSLLAYLFVLAGLPLAWAQGANGIDSTLGSLTFLFCLIGAWASWAGMWKMWSMPAITSGMLGLVLFLAPLDAVIYGLFGMLRVVTGSKGPIAEQWTGNVDEGFLAYGVGPSLVLLGGCIATYELFHGAKKGMMANKEKKQAEIDARKAARKAKKDAATSAEAPAGEAK